MTLTYRKSSEGDKMSGRRGLGRKRRGSETRGFARAVFEPLEGRALLSTTLISEDFSAGAGGVAAAAGTWAASAGAYRVTVPIATATTHLNTRAIHAANAAGDFTLTADASAVDTPAAWNDFALIFGYQDSNNYYFFSSNESNDDDTSGIFKVAGGVSTSLPTSPRRSPPARPTASALSGRATRSAPTATACSSPRPRTSPSRPAKSGSEPRATRRCSTTCW